MIIKIIANVLSSGKVHLIFWEVCPCGSVVKNVPARHGFNPWSRKIPTFHGTTKRVPKITELVL